MNLDDINAVLTVGDGRGFVITHKRHIGRYVVSERCVITAAHCLPGLPVIHGEPGWGNWDTTYQKLLAPLGGKPAVWAECKFVEPVSDLAVLGQPDNQALSEPAEAYDELMESVTPLEIAIPGKEGWLLSLDGIWFRCTVSFSGPALALTNMEGLFTAGMSGSPIVSPEGAAVGVACRGGESGGRHSEIIGPQPSLAGNLPGWLLAELKEKQD
jgi:hypothetical protein